MPDIQKVNESLEAAVQSLLNLKKALNEEPQEVTAQSQMTPMTPMSQQIEQTEDYDSFESLKSAVHSDKWPSAVNPNLICDPNSSQDKEERARGIIELMIEQDLKGTKFLDYGCADGAVVNLSKEYETELSVGYDLAQRNWIQVTGAFNTYDFEQVKANGPYDVILLFDVIDHLQSETPVQVLSKVKDLLKDDGRIYMRCHPITSRHATHLYHEMNKAYLHLVFTPEELKQVVPSSSHEETNNGPKFPIMGYNNYIKEVGLKVVNRRDLTEKVESFFKIPKIADRICKTLGSDSFPDFQMSLQFIDFVLSK